MKTLEMNTTVLNEEELLAVDGGYMTYDSDGGDVGNYPSTYYGNGVYCDDAKCWVDWGTANTCIAKYAIGGWFGAVPGKC